MYLVADHTPCLPQTHPKFVKFNMQRGNVSVEKSEFKPDLFLLSPSNSTDKSNLRKVYCGLHFQYL